MEQVSNNIKNKIQKDYLILYENRNKDKEKNGAKLLQQLERLREIAIGRGDLKTALDTIKFWAKVMNLDSETTIDVETHRVKIFKLPDNERVYNDQHLPYNHAPKG